MTNLEYYSAPEQMIRFAYYGAWCDEVLKPKILKPHNLDCENTDYLYCRVLEHKWLLEEHNTNDDINLKHGDIVWVKNLASDSLACLRVFHHYDETYKLYYCYPDTCSEHVNKDEPLKSWKYAKLFKLEDFLND